MELEVNDASRMVEYCGLRVVVQGKDLRWEPRDKGVSLGVEMIRYPHPNSLGPRSQRSGAVIGALCYVDNLSSDIEVKCYGWGRSLREFYDRGYTMNDLRRGVQLFVQRNFIQYQDVMVKILRLFGQILARVAVTGESG